MTETLEDLLRRLAAQADRYLTINEEATRQSLILPVLEALGWNWRDVTEVEPEFRVSDGVVDYCLRVGDKPAVFAEVKRPSEDLELHEEQLCAYAFREGVDLAALTNGLVWWFYQPCVGGKWQQRKFFTIDIRQQQPEQAAEHFRQFLGRAAVADGSARENADRVRASRDREIKIRETFPEVWEDLLQGPDERLLDLLADKIESKCGHRPDCAMLTALLRKEHVVPPSPPPPPRPVPPRPEPRPHGQRRHSATIAIGDIVIHARSVPDMYEQVLTYLCQTSLIVKLDRHLPYATGSKRYLLAREARHPRGNPFVNPVQHRGYYMEAHKQYGQAIRELANLVKLCGLTVDDRGL